MITLNFLLTPPQTIQPLELDIFTFNLLSSPHGISYFDPQLNKVTPYTINLEDFETNLTQKKLNQSFYYGDENLHIAARITLANEEGNELKTIFYNKGIGETHGFEYWATATVMESGKNIPTYHIRSMPVLIRQKISNHIEFNPGTIIIEVVTP